MHVNITPSDYMHEYVLPMTERMSPFQEQVIEAMSSCDIVLIRTPARASGLTTALMGYITWEMEMTDRPLDIGYCSLNNRNVEYQVESMLGRVGARPIQKGLWKNEHTGSQLRVISSLSRQSFPMDVYIIDGGVNSHDTVNDICEHITYNATKVGTRGYIQPTFGGRAYDVKPKPITYQGSRYVIVGDYAPAFLDKFPYMNLSKDDVAYIDGKKAYNLVWYAPAGINRGYAIHP